MEENLSGTLRHLGAPDAFVIAAISRNIWQISGGITGIADNIWYDALLG
jgi:hypothetical protein